MVTFFERLTIAILDVWVLCTKFIDGFIIISLIKRKINNTLNSWLKDKNMVDHNAAADKQIDSMTDKVADREVAGASSAVENLQSDAAAE